MEPQSSSKTHREAPPPRDIKDEVSVLLQGNRLKINATVDADGIGRLKQMLNKYQEILKLLQ
jgi:hypothetical protein